MRRIQRDWAKIKAISIPTTMLAARPPAASSDVMASEVINEGKRATTALPTASGGGSIYGGRCRMRSSACHSRRRPAKTATALSRVTTYFFMQHALRAELVRLRSPEIQTADSPASRRSGETEDQSGSLARSGQAMAPGGSRGKREIRIQQ